MNRYREQIRTTKERIAAGQDASIFSNMLNGLMTSLAKSQSRLKLEREYLNDNIKELKLELDGKRELLESATEHLNQVQLLHKRGVTPSSEVRQATSSKTQCEFAVRQAQLSYDRFVKILDRWDQTVGNALDNESNEDAVD